MGKREYEAGREFGTIYGLATPSLGPKSRANGSSGVSAWLSMALTRGCDGVGAALANVDVARVADGAAAVGDVAWIARRHARQRCLTVRADLCKRHHFCIPARQERVKG